MLSAAGLFVIFPLYMTCGSSVRGMQNLANSACGLAEQCSIVESFVHQNPFCHAPLGMSQRAAWQMTKTELLAEANRLGLAPHPDWTAVELRSAITEMIGDQKGGTLPKGLSSMKLQELKEEAEKIGLEYGEKVTRGALIRNIRDYHDTPSNTVMTIGKHRGNTYAQIPLSYGRWADAEEKVNGANMHPDLRRYVMWYRRNRNGNLPEPVTTLEKMNNPEKYAVVDEQSQNLDGASELSWDEVRSLASASRTKKGYNDDRQLLVKPKETASSSSSRPAKRPVDKDQGVARMGIEPDPKITDEIKALETRLATLKQQLGPSDTGDGL